MNWPGSAPKRLGLNPDPFLREAPFYTGLPAMVKEALSAGTPKAVETALDRRRWSYLEELETGTQFDLGRLIVYRLKLLLLERKSQFRPEPGLESFTTGIHQGFRQRGRVDKRREPPIGYGETT